MKSNHRLLFVIPLGTAMQKISNGMTKSAVQPIPNGMTKSAMHKISNGLKTQRHSRRQILAFIATVEQKIIHLLPKR